MRASALQQRLKRARELETECPFAAEVLRFYAEVASFQEVVAAELEREGRRFPDTNSFAALLDTTLLIPHFRELLRCMHTIGSSDLALAADRLSRRGPEAWDELMREYWRGNSDLELEPRDPRAFFAHAVLQPYAEWLAGERNWNESATARPVCPFCSRPCLLAVLRPEGDGGKRSLVCNLCLTEWSYPRLICAACGEEDPAKLVIYTAADFPHIRLDACDGCGQYVKTIDLTRNGRAVPVVDELAAIPLDLWAADHGYTKLQGNLLGV